MEYIRRLENSENRDCDGRLLTLAEFTPSIGFVSLFRIFIRRGDVGRSFNRFRVLPVMSVVPLTA